MSEAMTQRHGLNHIVRWPETRNSVGQRAEANVRVGTAESRTRLVSRRTNPIASLPSNTVVKRARRMLPSPAGGKRMESFDGEEKGGSREEP
jgi:hypothetical protein